MSDWNHVKGIGLARRSSLEQAGLFCPEMLVEQLPIGYRDASHPLSLNQLRPGMEAAFFAVPEHPRTVQANGKQYVTATLRDGDFTLRAYWFSSPWMRRILANNERTLFWGRLIQTSQGSVTAINPVILQEQSIQPLYRPIESIPQKVHRDIIEESLETGSFPDILPPAFRLRYQLEPRIRALREAHFPSSSQNLQNARRRLAFEDLTLFQARLQSLRIRSQNGIIIPSDISDEEQYWNLLSFSPTEAQKRVLHEIAVDLVSQKPAARLIQGDVGCGKTAVAAGALYLTVKKGFQGALMAPTEVLAVQHYHNLCKLFEPLGITCTLLTGRLTAKEKKEARINAANGTAQIIIGTHALISDGVHFSKLGLAITDEQHRFGVRQRTRLSDSCDGKFPNVLVMSATPIPRTLSLILYGDLDVSIIDELPSGRKPITTRIVPECKRNDMYSFLRKQIESGRQIYFVCPLIDKSEVLDLLSAQELYKSLIEHIFPDLTVGLVHGRMKGAEKEQILSDFRSGKIKILVSTTVIEVGIDVPNASVMVIENADQFGLSQLHQLRGRVGRGSTESYCFLMSPPNQRLQTMVRTCDGFAIAQEDLNQRGPGEWFGTRQHGTPEMPGAALCNDITLLDETHRAVQELFADSSRADEAHALLEAAVMRYSNDSLNIGLN